MIKSICKCFDILELLSEYNDRELKLGFIADRLKMDRGTCANIIRTLLNRGYLQQSVPRGGYKLGYTLFSLTNNEMFFDELVKVAREDVDRLGRTLNEAAILSVIKNDRRLVLYQTVPDRDIVVRTVASKDVYSTNTGRVILANYTSAHQEKFVIRVGIPPEDVWPGIASSENPHGAMMNALAEIRHKGYSEYSGSDTIAGYSAPLFRVGHVVGSVGIYLPMTRMCDKKVIIDALMSSANEINRKLALTDGLG